MDFRYPLCMIQAFAIALTTYFWGKDFEDAQLDGNDLG